jgi:ABC-type sugar transport system permease subunit
MKKVKNFFSKVSLYMDKVRHFMSHNFVFTGDHEYWTFFKIIHLRVTNKRRQAVIGVSFIFIWIVGYLIFALYPMMYSLYLSFFKVRLAGADIDMTFEGINNYKAAFLYDPYFVEILIKYVVEMILNVPITIVFALIIAMLINQDIKGKGAWRTVFFLPVIITTGPVIQELMAQGATTLPSIQNYEVIDIVLDNLNSALANPIQTLFDTILLVLWFTGIQILIFLAGLQKIDREIYEASMIDGAGPWESFWKITLPSIMPLVSVVIIYTVVSMSVFGLNEVIIYIRNVMLGESTVGTLTTGYGYSAALAWIYFIVMVLLILVFVGAVNIKRRSRR